MHYWVASYGCKLLFCFFFWINLNFKLFFFSQCRECRRKQKFFFVFKLVAVQEQDHSWWVKNKIKVILHVLSYINLKIILNNFFCNASRAHSLHHIRKNMKNFCYTKKYYYMLAFCHVTTHVRIINTQKSTYMLLFCLEQQYFVWRVASQWPYYYYLVLSSQISQNVTIICNFCIFCTIIGDVLLANFCVFIIVVFVLLIIL